MSVIELGEITEAQHTPAAPLNRPLIRRVALALATVLGLGLLGGAARPAPSPVRPVWSTPMHDGESSSFTADTAYLARAVDGHTEITAYALATGDRLWESTLSQTVPAAPERTGDVLLVSADPTTVEQKETNDTIYTIWFYRVTIALDPATGAELWRTAGDQDTTPHDGTIVITERDARGAIARLKLVELKTGRPIWSRALPGAVTWAVLERTGRPREVVTAAGDGRLTTLGYADGAVLRSGKVPGTIDFQTQLYAFGDVLAVVAADRARSSVAVYRPDDLSPLWRDEADDGYATECLPNVCLIDGDTITARDPATGRTQWSHDGLGSVQAAGPGRLLLGDPEHEEHFVLADADTGRLIGREVSGQPLWPSVRSDSALVLRTTRAPSGQVSITRVDLATGRQTLLGAIDPLQAVSCYDVNRYLVCPRGETLVITDLGPTDDG